MLEARILLFEMSQDCNHLSSIRTILGAESNLKLQHQVAPVVEPDQLFNQILSCLSDFHANMVLFLCRSGSLQLLLDVVSRFSKRSQSPFAVAVVESCGAEEMNELLHAGASEFLLPPFDRANVMPRIWRLINHCHLEDSTIRCIKEKMGLKGLVGESPAFINAIRHIQTLARCDVSGLIQGETGTGKELCARAMHYLSNRSGRPFVAVNCGAIPCDLIENELFGHEPGSFTGATTSSSGLIHEAEGGTLFLDEVDSLPLLAQVKLLRFLQEKEYRRLGSRKTCTADVRVLAAANTNLEQAIRGGRFRQDLYYRLNTLVLTLPPLRDRIGDISLLARSFVRKCVEQFNKPILHLSSSAIQRLTAYYWPGNVRELENVITRSVLLVEGPIIHAADLQMPPGCAAIADNSFRDLKAHMVAQFEQRYITELLQACDGNISKAAKAAHKNRRAFWQLMRKHNISCRMPSNSQSTIPSAIGCR